MQDAGRGSDSVSRRDFLKVVGVGLGTLVGALVGPQTQTLDLKGRVVTPGLIDAHCHLQIQGLMNTFFVPFLPPEVRTLDDMRAKLAEVVARTAKGEWIQGYFLVVDEGHLPNKQDLDPVSPDHPVWIMQQGGHYGSANSLALQVAGISAATPDPSGGIIERDARGEPTGVFYNHRAMDLLRRHAPTYTMEMVRDNIVSTQPLFAACGVTSFQDNNVRGVDTVATYQEAGRRGN
jgi:predicted amidohydrolase YtcJ